MRVLYAEAVYDDEEISAVLNVLKNNPHQLMSGENVRKFEQQVAKIFGKNYGIMVNSGSSANLLAINSLGLKPGSEIITPALTFSTTVAPIVQLGLVPAFVDVEPSTFVIDCGLIEEMITENTKAMLIPNLIGNLPDWNRIKQLADKYSLIVMEDSADTIGYSFDGGNTGQINDIVTSSFYASHIVTGAGFGGIMCTNNEAFAESATIMRSWGRASSLRDESEEVDQRFNTKVDGIEYDAKFMFNSMGYNFIPSELSAAFGLVQLKKLEKYKIIRQENYLALLNYFRLYEEFFILPSQLNITDTPMLAFPFIIKDGAPFSRRDMQIWFEENGIQTRTVFTGNILRHPGFKHIDRKESPSGYPNSNRVMSGGMLIGCHHGINNIQLDYIQETLKNFIGSR